MIRWKELTSERFAPAHCLYRRHFGARKSGEPLFLREYLKPKRQRAVIRKWKKNVRTRNKKISVSCFVSALRSQVPE